MLRYILNQNKLNNNNLNGLVRLVKFTNNPYNLINSSDIFILSSLYEGLPNVLLESQVLKKFIISTDCPTGPKEILMNGKAGFLFKPKDYKNLAKLIIYASKNKSKLKKMSNLGYKNLFSDSVRGVWRFSRLDRLERPRSCFYRFWRTKCNNEFRFL